MSARPARATKAGLPHNAGGFVLYKDATAGGTQQFISLQAILAHSGQHHRQSQFCVYLGDRAKQNIDRGTAEIFPRTLMNSQVDSAVFLLRDQ